MNLYILDLYYLKEYWAKPEKANNRQRRELNNADLLSLEEFQNIEIMKHPFQKEEELSIFRTLEE